MPRAPRRPFHLNFADEETSPWDPGQWDKRITPRGPATLRRPTDAVDTRMERPAAERLSEGLALLGLED